MKISDSQPPASDPDVNADVNADDVDSSHDVDNEEPSAFSKLLAKKRGTEEDGTELKRGKTGEKDVPPIGTAFSPGEKNFDTAVQARQVESKRAVAMPVELQQLVRELSVVVNAAGNQQVHIELNSNVLKGLHIRIERHEGAVAIQFQSTSDQVAGLLSKNLDALSEGLADRGLNVADIHVEGPKDAARARDFKGQSNPGGRGQGGRQGGRR